MLNRFKVPRCYAPFDAPFSHVGQIRRDSEISEMLANSLKFQSFSSS